MKKHKKLILNIVTVILFLGSLALIVGTIILEMRTQNISPDESSAIFGGQIENELYPYAGYVISYGDNLSVNLCGLTYIDEDIAVSAAHCFDSKLTAYLGYSLLELNPDSNFLAQDVVINPFWNGSNLESDIAVIKFPKDYYPINEYAQIATPKRGCNYDVLGYGMTENDQTGQQLEKLRKKAEVCIKSIDSETFTIVGKTGGVCFGDSGSPVFEKGTNKIVGFLSSIIQSGGSDSDLCSKNNSAIAVRLDANQNFVAAVKTNSFDTNVFAKCGESCNSKKCNFGMICDENSICNISNQSCIAIAGGYCSEITAIQCENGFTCSLNRCTTDNIIEQHKSALTTAINGTLTERQMVLQDLNETKSLFLYVGIGLFVLALGSKIGTLFVKR